MVRHDVNATEVDPMALAYHELRSPLGLIATAAAAGAADACAAEAHARFEVIRRVAERMLRTAGQVARLNCLSSEESTWFAPASVVAAALEDLRALGVPVRVQRGHSAAAARAFGVREQFEALVSSVLNNAVDHAAPGEAIRVAVRPTPHMLEIVVENTVGPQTRHRGAGLGSYIAERLAAHLGATLTAGRVDNVYRVSLGIAVTSAARRERRSA